MKINTCIICGWNFYGKEAVCCPRLDCRYCFNMARKSGSKINQILSLAHERGKFGFYFVIKKNENHTSSKTLGNLVNFGLLREEEKQYIITENGEILYNYIFGDNNARKSSP